MSYYRQQLEDYLKAYDVNAQAVYDIGGKESPVRNRCKSFNVDEYTILDLPEWDLNTYWLDRPRQADLIFCLEVFEYLIDPVMAIRNIANLLKSDGLAIVSFQFVYPHHNQLEFDSLRYTEYGVRRLAKLAGLEVRSITYRKDKTGLLKSFYSADGMRASKQYPEHDTTGFIVELRHV